MTPVIDFVEDAPRPTLQRDRHGWTLVNPGDLSKPATPYLNWCADCGWAGSISLSYRHAGPFCPRCHSRDIGTLTPGVHGRYVEDARAALTDRGFSDHVADEALRFLDEAGFETRRVTPSTPSESPSPKPVWDPDRPLTVGTVLVPTSTPEGPEKARSAWAHALGTQRQIVIVDGDHVGYLAQGYPSGPWLRDIRRATPDQLAAQTYERA